MCRADSARWAKGMKLQPLTLQRNKVKWVREGRRAPCPHSVPEIPSGGCFSLVSFNHNTADPPRNNHPFNGILPSEGFVKDTLGICLY